MQLKSSDGAAFSSAKAADEETKNLTDVGEKKKTLKVHPETMFPK